MSEELAEPVIWSRPITEEKIVIFYNGSVDISMIQLIIDELNMNNLERGFMFKEFVVVLNSGGGDATMINPFYNILKPLGLSAVMAIGQASSAAFQILLDCKKKRLPVYIDPFCHIIIHRVSNQYMAEERYERIIDYNESWVKKFEDMFDKSNEYFLKKMDKDVKKRYKDGLNLYFLGKDLIDAGLFDEFKHNVL
jgi:ATP-dependent protease ClpP protease subunit